jgi:SEC-C motif domain protein
MPKPDASSATASSCPCGSKKSYGQCCELLHSGAAADSAEALMRSRYSAYALNLEEYLQRSWHASTRPQRIGLEKIQSGAQRWLGLQIKRCETIDATHALVEFVARYKIDGRAFRLHETSRFVREHGHWFYLDGQQSD